MIFYTSDWHLIHKKIIRLTKRPFLSADEMAHEIIQRYNACVSDSDTCYFLGDIFVAPRDGKSHGEEAVLERLFGRKVLILGNHDDDLVQRLDLLKYFERVEECLDIVDNGYPITLCHYPMADAPVIREGGYMIHGHLHNNPIPEGEKQHDRMLNACVEVNRYTPATLEQLIQNNRLFRCLNR